MNESKTEPNARQQQPVIGMAKVIAARDAVSAAEDRLKQAVAEAMPVGSVVSYVHGRHVRFVRVVDYCHGDALIVVSERGQRYRLDSWRVAAVSR